VEVFRISSTAGVHPARTSRHAPSMDVRADARAGCVKMKWTMKKIKARPYVTRGITSK
jgi:hypothetical protein